MLKDCLEIFEAELERTKKRFGDSDRLILDEYILADGDYLVVEKNGEIRQCSVIILDEIQSYKNELWGEIITFLKGFAELMQMKIIIMSATLPNLDILTDNHCQG